MPARSGTATGSPGPGSRVSRRPSGQACRAFERWLDGERLVSTVRIPPTLRTATGGEKRVEVSGDTVREVVTGARGRASGPRGAAHRAGRRPEPFVNAFLNDTDIRHLAGPRHAGHASGDTLVAAAGDGRRLADYRVATDK